MAEKRRKYEGDALGLLLFDYRMREIEEALVVAVVDFYEEIAGVLFSPLADPVLVVALDVADAVGDVICIMRLFEGAVGR